jgi:hypothetical protein
MKCDSCDREFKNGDEVTMTIHGVVSSDEFQQTEGQTVEHADPEVCLDGQ